MRTLLTAAALLALAAPAAAQHQHGTPQKAQPATASGGHAHGGAAAMPDHSQYPAGWAVRVDRDAARDQVWLMDHGDALHAATGPAGAVYYNAGWQEQGDYDYSVRFRQQKASEHPEGYGLVIGGTGMDGAEQAYSYFLIRQTGDFFVATRRGEERTKVVDWTASPAIRRTDAQGKAENVLGVQVKGSDVVFTVNGTEVARRPKSELATDGALGLRVNHRLELLVDQVAR